jgi:hypothetical protein
MSQSKPQIPTIFKVSGVSFCKEVVNGLEKGQELKLELDPKNKYDTNAIKILTLEDDMCGFVPKNYKLENNEEFCLNKLLKKRFDKISKKYILKVYEIYKWDGPTGLDVHFVKKTN